MDEEEGLGVRRHRARRLDVGRPAVADHAHPAPALDLRRERVTVLDPVDVGLGAFDLERARRDVPSSARALDLELRCHISDVDNFAGVGTDLRFAIWKAFREGGLAFQPATDISLPQAVQVLATAVRERDGARGNGAAHGDAPEEAREPSNAA